jgi:hypothetical protein
MPTDVVPDIPAPPDATEVFARTQHGPDLARRPFLTTLAAADDDQESAPRARDDGPRAGWLSNRGDR